MTVDITHVVDQGFGLGNYLSQIEIQAEDMGKSSVIYQTVEQTPIQTEITFLQKPVKMIQPYLAMTLI